ncbi:competence type IV pilus minor pilin ComGD [Geomicrobium sediminis]|uniref:Competence protein ComGD n=1 Tax=Geomicrobium sediminis TaxID=1347788 RepID=A0ABS2PE41_9BACL|nr:competence protein ComGD [Geomicrobium sediminis]
MEKRLIRNEGFTLIEMAIVLLIVSICAFVSVAISTELMKQRATDAFIEQFVTDLYFAQQQAMANSQTVHVHVQTEALQYEVKMDEKVLTSQPFPEDMRAAGLTMAPDLIMFRTNGNLRFSGSFQFEGKRHNYRFVFLIGSGRFYYVKSKSRVHTH